MLLKLVATLLITIHSTRSELVLTDEMKELMNTLHNTCVDESGVSEDAIERARKGDFADDDKLKCYMKCTMEQMACVDEDGTVDIEATIAVLPEELQVKADPIIRKCGSKVGKNACDNVFLTQKCWYDSSPSEYFLV